MRALLRWIIMLTVPVILVVAVVRLATGAWFVAWEYSRPAFPPDPYGMTAGERLRLAQASVQFLNYPYDLSLLERLRFDDGTAAYNARELSHMADVKHVYDRITLWALLALALAGCAGWALFRRREASAFWGALSDGGLCVLAALLTLGVLMTLARDAFFVGLHGLFFAADTWLFAYDDTLIRLFPERLWQDAGFFVAGVTALAALTLALVGRIVQRRLDDGASTDETEKI